MPRELTPDQAVALLRPDDRIGLPLGPGQPPQFLAALGERDDWAGLTISGALLIAPSEAYTHPGVRIISGFFGPLERWLASDGHNVEFMPADFRRFGPLAEAVSPRILATVAAPPDADGWCSLSLHAGGTLDELRRAGADPDRLLVVETSPHFPRTHGLPPGYDAGEIAHAAGWRPEHRHALHLDEIDILIPGDAVPLALPETEPSETDRAIAEHAARFIADGATLQTGIGSIPTAIASLLAETPGGSYGIHSEMLTDGIRRLHQAGKVTNDGEGILPGYSVTTFAFGSQDLYDWLANDEPPIAFLPVGVVNNPTLIGANRRMVTINGAMQVDLTGQVVAEAIAGIQYSGAGGQEDFVSGPGTELEDRSLLCLPATRTTGEETISRIVAGLPAGSVVTTPRHQVDVIVTEFGAAELQGLTVRERGLALAEIAAPEFRDELRAHVRDLT